MHPINVKSEIGPLKKVMLHRPGREIEKLTPDTLRHLLFDDIPYLRIAQEEHDAFADLLRSSWCRGCIPGAVDGGSAGTE